MTTKVVHCKKAIFEVYIGRACYGFTHSVWGNPFEIGKDGTRVEVIAKYREYLLGNKELMSLLYQVKGKTLGCWCKPQNCHGDVIAEVADSTRFLEF